MKLEDIAREALAVPLHVLKQSLPARAVNNYSSDK
jgi:hypothetical protein